MSVVDPIAALRRDEPGPLYWIYGKEQFLVDRAVTLLKERVLEPATSAFNYDLLYGKEAGAAKILATARTLPMMAHRRLVLVREADGLDAKQLDGFLAYLEAPAPETCLVFVSEKADQRLKFFATFKRRGVLLKLDPLPERQLGSFVRGEAAGRGLRMEPGVAELIADEIGGDLGQIGQAIERLALFVGERRTITLADVEEVVERSRQRSVFELCDAVGGGDAERALRALGSLLDAREPALRILAMLGRQVRQLVLVRSLLDGRPRVGRAELAERLALPPFVVEKLEAQARRFDHGALSAMHRAVYRTDRRLKSSKLDDARVMELLVLELVRMKGAATRAR